MLIGRRKPLTAAQQFVNLRGNPVSRGKGELRAGRLTWRYSATPSPLSRDYDIRIEFRQGGRPKTFVDGPDLHALAGGRRLPHLQMHQWVTGALQNPNCALAGGDRLPMVGTMGSWHPPREDRAGRRKQATVVPR
jgi:hypothetical protein